MKTIVDVLSNMIFRVANIVFWLLVFVVHFVLIVIFFWIFQITPHGAKVFFLQCCSSTAASILGVVGLSIFSVFLFYLNILRKFLFQKFLDHVANSLRDDVDFG